MQSSKNTFGPSSDEVKRTTLILEKEDRKYIDQLIKDGKESGIKSLISKLLNIYQKLMICNWDFPGKYYYGISRVAFINAELINVLIQNTPKEKLYETGKKMGELLKVSIDIVIHVDASKSENWEEAFKQLSVQGLGCFELKDKYLLLKESFFNEPLLLEGIIEGLFGIKVQTKTLTSLIVFEIISSI